MEAATATLGGGTRTSGAGTRLAFRVELRKLTSQLAIRLVALICVLGPFAFAAILKIQTGTPTDTLYGGWVHESGFAVSLVVLTFAGQWGFPVVAGLVAGDVFSSEDRYSTWKLVLTRSCTRAEVFAGKCLAAGTVSVATVALVALSSLAAGLVFIGDQSLVDLGGNLLSPWKLLFLVLVGWLVAVPPTLAFASLAILLSVATRNGIVGVIGPALIALAMQLLLLVGSGVWVHLLLVGSAFLSWHGLFADPSYYGPLLIGIVVSLAWIAASLGIAWSLLRRRDFAGAPVARRQGWVTPVRVAVALAATLAFLAIASNWGPAGVTPSRLQSSLVSNFNNLTALQQSELGRTSTPAGQLNISQPTCSRRGSTSNGPGEWVCTLHAQAPPANGVTPPPTSVNYDLNVQSDGCYKAQSPPAFAGAQVMFDAQGDEVVNPLYTIYGCFNPL